MGHFPNLYPLKRSNTNSKHFEVNVLNGDDEFHSFLFGKPTTIPITQAVNMDFAVADYDGDGHPDIFCMDKIPPGGRKFLEVSVLNGANDFQSFLTGKTTTIPITQAVNMDFAVADYDGDGHPDIFCMDKIPPGGRKFLEVSVLNGANDFQSFLMGTTTTIPITQTTDFVYRVPVVSKQRHSVQSTTGLWCCLVYKQLVAPDGTIRISNIWSETISSRDRFGAEYQASHLNRQHGGSNAIVRPGPCR